MKKTLKSLEVLFSNFILEKQKTEILVGLFFEQYSGLMPCASARRRSWLDRQASLGDQVNSSSFPGLLFSGLHYSDILFKLIEGQYWLDHRANQKYLVSD